MYDHLVMGCISHHVLTFNKVNIDSTNPYISTTYCIMYKQGMCNSHVSVLTKQSFTLSVKLYHYQPCLLGINFQHQPTIYSKTEVGSQIEISCFIHHSLFYNTKQTFYASHQLLIFCMMLMMVSPCPDLYPPLLRSPARQPCLYC